MQHFIFDFDGTISDSYPIFVKIGKEIAEEDGAEIPFDDTELYRLYKISTKTVYQSISWKSGLTRQQYATRFGELQTKHSAEFHPFPEAVHLLKALKKKGKKLYLYTHTGKAIYDILKDMGLEGTFDFIIDASMQFPSKPAPDALLFLMDKFQLKAEECLMIGDRPIDVQAASNAGIKGCLWDADGFFPDCSTDYKIKALAELEQIFLR
ncbi:MAG: HAD-IA family hydrolase [Clostridia bacterium]|nr:HAD-IA family hydrolase [Clostridia bacterium]